MQIPKLNILNIKSTKPSFASQNPISFKSEQKNTIWKHFPKGARIN